jgi:hypothetical protein
MTASTSPGPPAAQRTDRALSHGYRAGAATSLCLGLAWLVLSWWHPAVTYHFGPPLAAVAWPVLLRARLRHPVRRGHALGRSPAGLRSPWPCLVLRPPPGGCAVRP